MVTRRAFAASGLALLLSSCTDEASLNAFRLITEFAKGGAEDPELDRAQIANLPYAIITAKIGGAKRAVLVLSRYEAGGLEWMAANRVTLVTRYGRIVKTAGLPQDLREVWSQDPDPLADAPHRLAGPVAWRRDMDILGQRRLVYTIDAEIRPLHEERIVILEREYDTLLLEERNRALAANWQFVNRFWVDKADGRVWRSVQHTSRDLASLQIDVLKQAAAPEGRDPARSA